MADKPVIVIVPGFWEGSRVFDNVSEQLRSAGYLTVVASPRSTGTSSYAGYRIWDDVESVREVVKSYVEDGKIVLLAMHSIGGVYGSMALRGLTSKARRNQGKKGGVERLLYIAAVTSHTDDDLLHSMERNVSPKLYSNVRHETKLGPFILSTHLSRIDRELRKF